MNNIEYITAGGGKRGGGGAWLEKEIPLKLIYITSSCLITETAIKSESC